MRRVSYAASFGLPFMCAVGLWVAPSPAAAEDSFLALGSVGSLLNFSQERAAIDFSERPPLVVPPTNTLPSPGSGAPALTVNDPDMVARRRALTDSRRPVPPSDPGATQKGLNARAYLVDPPSGLRNPQAVASDITTDRSAIKPARHHHASKKMRVEQASQ